MRARERRFSRPVMSSFQEWKNLNASVFAKVTFISGEESSSPEFIEKRRAQLMRTVNDLTSAISVVDTKLKEVERDLSTVSGNEIPDVDYLAYDDPSQTLLLRKYTYIRQKVRKHQIQFCTKKFGVLTDWRNEMLELIDLVQGDLIPSDQIIIIPVEYFHIDCRIVTNFHLNKLRYYLAASRRMKAEIESWKKAQWATDYKGFIKSLVAEGSSHLITELSYFVPLEREVQLSRCLFCYKSPHQQQIDRVVDQISRLPGPEFINLILEECYRMIQPSWGLSHQEQSIALLFFFRCVFNRCYERYPSFFAPKTQHDLDVLFELPSFAAKQFLLPANLLGKDVGDTSIGDFFRENQYFRAASMFLEQALLMPNPIDCLYCIHKTLVGIHKGALINRMGGNSASMSDVKQLLCFDDLFALFFGCLMATGPPTTDIHYCAWMIEEFTPKEALSPSFEYAQANLEALAMHCKRLDVQKLREGCVVQRLQ